MTEHEIERLRQCLTCGRNPRDCGCDDSDEDEYGMCTMWRGRGVRGVNERTIRLLAKHPKRNRRPLIIHTDCWWQGYDGDLIMVTEDSWHVLWKRNRPKRMRKAK